MIAQPKLDSAENASLPTEIQWMPPGEHEIQGAVNGKPKPMTVVVDKAAAARVIASFEELLKKHEAGAGDLPYIDFNHEGAAAAGHVSRLFWGGDDPKTGGIRAEVQWTKAGATAIANREYLRFSPEFYTEKGSSKIIFVDTNLGGLVNQAAFTTIRPVLGRAAAAHADEEESDAQPNKNTAMKNLLATLVACALLKSADVDEATAVTEVTAAHKRLVDDGAKKVTDAVSAAETRATKAEGDLVTAKADVTAARKMHAEFVVAAACKDGRIAPQADKIKAKWIDRITANPEDAELLGEAPAPGTILGKTIVPPGSGADENKAGKKKIDDGKDLPEPTGYARVKAACQKEAQDRITAAATSKN